MEESKKKNVLIITLMFLVIILVVLCIYFVLFKKNAEVIDNSPSNNDVEINTEENDLKPVSNNNDEHIEKIYKTSDGKFTLKILDKNNEQAKRDLEKSIRSDFDDDDPRKENYSLDDDEDSYNEIMYFAYFNDVIMFVSDIKKEDEHYITYSFGGYKDAESWDYTLIINKDTNTIEINPVDLIDKYTNCMESNFCSFMKEANFIKTDLGYFFIDRYNNELYTITWKKLGYVRLHYNDDNSYELKDIDSTGVTVYTDLKYLECDGDMYSDNCEVEYLNPVKYDVNGSIVN